MTFEIVKDGIKPPAQNNLTWVFPVRLTDDRGSIERDWLVDDFDLHLWFKEAVGRYPRHEGSDTDTLEDLRANWTQVEPHLHRELAREAKLGVLVAVDGTRTSVNEWRAVQQVPREELPPLTKAQREAAESLKISEEDYARDLLAAEKTRAGLMNKTERFASLLQKLLSSAEAKTTIKEVTLRTLEGRFDVELEVDRRRLTIRVAEDIFDDLIERGSDEAERRLRRIVEANLPEQVAR